MFCSPISSAGSAPACASAASLARATTWFLRTFVTSFAIFWVGGFDAITIAAWVLVAIAFGAGIWSEIRPKRDESVHLDLR